MFYLFLLAHLVADFIFQPYVLVKRKNRLDGLAIHCAIVLAFMALIPLFEPQAGTLWPAMLAITAVHFGADWWKVRYGHLIPGPPIVPFLVDQIIHVTTLVIVLNMAMPAQQLWALHGSSVSYPAMIGIVYVVAAFATPIAVMIWLDPRFTHLALAGRARIRSFALSMAVVSLMLVSGFLALPAALVGLTVAARRPGAVHPLDTPIGTLAVLTSASALGALLLLLPHP